MIARFKFETVWLCVAGTVDWRLVANVHKAVR